MFEMPEAWLPIVNALIEAPVAWRTPAEVAVALGRDVEEVTDLLGDLDVAGWVDVWDRDPMPLVTLTPLAAERLHLHLVEVGGDEVPRWAREGDPPPPSPRAKHVCASEGAAALDFVPDRLATPDVAAEQAEEADALASNLPDGGTRAVKAEDLPWPSRLVGQGLTPWPGPDRVSYARCPACGSRRLEPHEYCLCCDRWGMDWKLRLDPSSRTPPRPGPAAVSPEEQARRDRQQVGRHRARRKAKRKAHHQARAEAERLSRKGGSTKLKQTPAPQEPSPNQGSPASPRSSRALR
jgi:hypothetical protein